MGRKPKDRTPRGAGNPKKRLAWTIERRFLYSMRYTGALLLYLLWSSVGAAQQMPSEAQIARFRLADSYLRAGQLERALPILEELYRSDPGSYVFYDKLREVYTGLKRYTEAEGLVRAQLARQPDNPTLYCDLASIQLARGNREEALRSWNRALEIAPSQPQVYRIVYYSQFNNRLLDEAARTLLEGRRKLNNPTLFALELAMLYSTTGQYEAAVGEYLMVLRTEPQQLGFVRARLGRLLQDSTLVPSITRLIERAVQREPLFRPYRELLAWVYLEIGRYEEAYRAVRALDRLERAEGQFLFRFAEQAYAAGAWGAAQQAYEELLGQFPAFPLSRTVRLRLGEVYEQLAAAKEDSALYRKAISYYETYAQEPDPTSPPVEIWLRLGRLYRDIFRQNEAARRYLEQALQASQAETEQLLQALYELGRLALEEGNLDQARLYFIRLTARAQEGELYDQARLELAWLDFYQGAFDGALSLADVLAQSTDRDIANDAIALKVLLEENRARDSTYAQLRQYARAALLLAQRRYPEALQAIEEARQHLAASALVEELYMLEAEVYHRTRQWERLEATYRLVTERFPGSFQAERAWLALGKLYEQILHDPARAMQAYETLLERYPTSVLIDEARYRIRRLRGETS
jgi:tetratricopeptide (TPR) repeat protein